MKAKSAIAWIGLILWMSAAAQSMDRPTVRQGDSWVYRSTVEKGPSGWNQVHNEITVTRVTSSSIYFTVRQNGSTQSGREVYAQSDWARVRDVNGRETVVNRPLEFPLTAGKSWKLTFEEQNPNPRHKSEKWDYRFTVVGYEDVQVPAGTFHALKIESEGTWSAEVAPGETVVQGGQSNAAGTTLATETHKTVPHETSGRLYKAYWYVPDVKRWVKAVEEDYSSGGVRNERFTDELESFKPAG